jgi:hypothetical protein
MKSSPLPATLTRRVHCPGEGDIKMSVDDFDKVRRHFRRETGKLDNWIYHRRLDEYIVQEKETPEDAEEKKADG